MTTNSLHRVSVKPGDRIFPCYDVPMRCDDKGKSTGTPLYSRANDPSELKRKNVEPEIVHHLNKAGFPMVELKGHSTPAKPIYFERRKFIAERSIWSDADVVADTHRVLCLVASRIVAYEDVINQRPEIARRFYRAINLMDSQLIDALYSKA